MDADDVAMPHRFEVELPLIAEADIVGAGLLEFVGDTDDIVGQRVPPTDPAQIRRYARMHDPFNHPTVVYRRQRGAGRGRLRRPAADGGLRAVRPHARRRRAARSTWPSRWSTTGSAPTPFKRRGGTRPAALRAAAAARVPRGSGFTSPPEYVRNVLVRGGYRLIPWRFRRAVYRPIVAHYTERRGRSRTAARPPERPGTRRGH